MRNYPKALKRKLLDTICQMREDLSAYATDPKRDFTRSRKLPFETLCRTILSMSGQSLNVELQRQFHYDPTAATASAFVQRRGKLLPAAFEEILRRFTSENRPIRRWNGYTLLAVDGSHVQIPSNIHDKATHFNSTKDGRGYNLLHLNALYDLENQLYLDAVIQNVREEHESRALVELVDRSRLKEPVIMIADRGYEAYNNIAHIEQKNWNYLIRAKAYFQGLSCLIHRNSMWPSAISCPNASPTVSAGSLRNTVGFPARFVSIISKTQAMRCIPSPSAWSDLRSKMACTRL